MIEKYLFTKYSLLIVYIMNIREFYNFVVLNIIFNFLSKAIIINILLIFKGFT